MGSLDLLQREKKDLKIAAESRIKDLVIRMGRAEKNNMKAASVIKQFIEERDELKMQLQDTKAELARSERRVRFLEKMKRSGIRMVK